MAKNAFDKLAKPKSESTAKKSTKVTASVTDDVKVAVDKVIDVKGKLKLLEAEGLQAEMKIIEHVRPQQDNNARSGNFANAYLVEGMNGAVTYVTADKFSVPKDESIQEEIKGLIGAKRFNEFFETKRAVSIKSEVLQNDELVNKIVETLEAAGVEGIFEVIDTLVAKKGLDEKLYDLDADTLEKFRALVPQAKPSIRA